MSAIKIKQAKENCLSVEGDLTFATINKNTARLMQKLLIPGNMTIDLKLVQASDSAGLALIIEWLKMAESRKTKLAFMNTPTQLMAIAQLSGFESLFQSTDQP